MYNGKSVLFTKHSPHISNPFLIFHLPKLKKQQPAFKKIKIN